MLTSFQTATYNETKTDSIPTSHLDALISSKIPSQEYNSITITSREREILHLIAYVYSSKEIAAKLFISYETVNSHRKNIMNKMDVKNTAGMVRVAYERRLLMR